tara:strand:- start:581 stop:1330 length:750 start_codon:yes stop_codon:yes gene_type:complete
LTEYSIEVEGVSKKFKIFHEKRNSIFESIIGWFQRSKHYEEIEVLKDISFKIKKGEVLGIIGKNGEGKTTLLRMISGVYSPDKGKITVNGSLIPFLGLGVGFMGELTARSNVIQYGLLLGFTKKQIREKVDDVIKYAELEKFADTKIKNFSSGMYTRLAFATAIQVDPDILIIDEAIQVGDLSFQKKSYETIMNFKKRGKTIIMVSHDMTPIKEKCDSVIFLKDGVIEKKGSPKEVISAYLNSLNLSEN